VIIGAAQVSQQPPVNDALRDAPDPIDLITDAVRDAAVDSAGDGVIDAIDTIAVIGGLWRYRNPGALVAEELGVDGVHTILTTFGGNLPIHATHLMAERIAAGDIDVAVIAGGECTLTRRNLAKRGESPRRREEQKADEVENWGPALDMGDLIAIDRGGETPRNSYAVLDSAIRANRGESLDAARDRAANLWAGYAAVAASNPHAADRSAPTAEQIRNPSPTNRMVSWPYTKAMCANNTVDQAGALIICSSAAADRLGVPIERRVHPHRCIISVDSTSLLEREQIYTAPGLRSAAARLIDMVGSAAAIDHIDLYSCFPSIVTLTVEALGLDPDRPLTVNGGLAFAGSPLNFAAGMGLISMIETLRSDPGSTGVVQGNGGHATKHAFGIYSTDPPTEPHRIDDLGQVSTVTAVADGERAGPATLDGVTVEYDRDGPTRAIAIVRFDDGSRAWAVSNEPELMCTFVEEESVGRRVMVDAGEMMLTQWE
jgi:acetyl-CoA C-acetyltransferase